MTSILTPYSCWLPSGPMEQPDASYKHSEHMAGDLPSTSSTPSTSTSTSPRSTEPFNSWLPNELGAAFTHPNEILNYSGFPPTQLYTLQQLHNPALYQQQLLLRHLAAPMPVMTSQQTLPYVPGFTTLPTAPMAVAGSAASANSTASSRNSLDANPELPESTRRTKRKRSDRSLLSSDGRLEGEESDSESAGERSRVKQPKLSAESVPETDLSDITNLLSLPQKEAAQRLGISESMLCKRFKECTRRKWPFRFLRKIEKTIASLQSQKDIEPLSVEDQDRLEDLLRQRLECLAPVKIRITKSPSPVPCSRSGAFENDSNSTLHDDDSDSDDSDTSETDYETEAVENLIHLSRATSPRSFLPATQLAC